MVQITRPWTPPKEEEENASTGWHLKLPQEVGIIIGALIAALVAGFAINSILGGNPGNPALWVAATLAVVFGTICIAAFGVHRDRVQDMRYREYMRKLDAVKEEGNKRYGKFF